MSRKTNVLCAIGAHVDEVLRLNVAARPGESIPAVPERAVGGCAFNVAAALAAAGHGVVHAGLRGDDADARLIARGLVERRVREVVVTLGTDETAGTGRYVALLNPDGTLALAAAAMAAYDHAGRLARAPEFRAAAAEADALVLDANASPAHCASLAAARGSDTSLVLLATSAGKARSVAGLLGDAAILFANDAEWRELRDGPTPALAFVTHGERGASVVENGETALTLPSRAARVASVIGAGDAFAAGVLDMWARGAPPRVALERGLDCAARCVASPDALSWLDDMEWPQA